MVRNRPRKGPPGDGGPPFDMGPPGWGPPPPGGWGPPPPDEWGPPPPGGWGPLPPEGWGPRGPPPPDWGPRGLPPPGWGLHPDDWLHPAEHWGRLHPDDLTPPHPDDLRPPHPDDLRPPHPDDLRAPHPDDLRCLHPDLRPPHPNDLRPPHPDDWRFHPEDWRPPHWRPRPEDWGPHGWGREGPSELWPPEAVPPGPLPPPPVCVPPPVGVPPPDPAAYGPVPIPPPVPPPACVPPLGFPAYPPPGWTGEPVVEEVMPNPPPDQPEWIKALISNPSTELTPGETKKSTEEPAVTTTPAAGPAAAPKPKPKPKTDPTKAAKALGLLGKRSFDKPPPGRSTGIISFIGPTFGYIEREDLEKFTFSFAAFFGNPKAMTPGVRVHFTACKEKNNSLIATDVKVAPGGTENVDPEIYEAVVSQPITEPQPGERQYPGQVHVNIGPLRTSLTFDRKDSTVTLLKDDQVLINLLTDIVSEKRRATNIKPKIPSTFSHTKETREEGVIVSLKDNEGLIKSDQHGELSFSITENFSDIEFTAEDVNENVEFTVIMLRAGKRAIRIRRVKEPLLLTLCSATAAIEEAETQNADDNGEGDSSKWLKGKANVKPELAPNMHLDTELYEGVVSQPIIEPTSTIQGYPGQIHANIGPVSTNVTFDHRDCGVTLLKNDHVLINLLVDVMTKKRRAANIKPKVPFTFSYTKEKRELGIITWLGADEGIVNSDEHGELPFDICENFSDTEFTATDIHKEVEFTVAMVKSKKRAIRLLRTKRAEDQILEEQKRREEEAKKKKQEVEQRKRREEVERKKKEEVAAALEAAKCKWTPLGFKIRVPDTMDDISKERFEGTVLKAISKNIKKIKMEPKEQRGGGGGGAEAGQTLLGQLKIKVEKTDEEENEGVEGKPEADGEEVKMEVKKEEEEVVIKNQSADTEGGAAAGGRASTDPEMGRLVMTIDGQQKQLSFCPNDLLTTATMLDGDKVRFNIATHQETKEERATYVEILPDSFEESIEQRRHGIVIEFSDDSGLIKCTQNPQLYFHMSEVIEKKKLELNEKVEFSVVPHETAEGGNQAIRIKRHAESIFLPVRKLGGVGATKGKMTIKLTKSSEDAEKGKPDAEKLKAVVKSLRSQDSKTGISRRDYSTARRRYGRSRSRSRSRSQSRSRAKSRSKSRSRSPPRDQFGRIIKQRHSTSADHDHKSSRHRRSRSRERSNRHPNSPKKSRSQSKSSSRSRSRSRSGSRSRSRERSKDQTHKRRSKISREREESHKRRREVSPPPRRVGVMDDELARKKRELEELNEMIAYKKSLVDVDPGQRTCIDYNHGRIAVPLTEYKPVRSTLKKQPEGHLPHLYDDPYYDRPYSPYQDRRYDDRYGDPYTRRPYSERPYDDRSYGDRPYESRVYGEALYAGPPSASQRYTDRYDVYDEPYDDRYYDPVYVDRPYNDPYCPVKQSHSPERHSSSSPPHPGRIPAASTQPHYTVSPSSSRPPFRPPSPTEPPPRSPSPKLTNTTPCQSPPAEKPPLDRFLDMLNNKVDAEKKSKPVYVNDDLLPHERAIQDGRGFSRIVGLAQEQPSSSSSLTLEGEKKQVRHKRSSVERTSEEPKSQTEPYDKIQSLLRTIGLKLSTGDMSKLASRAQEKIYSPKSSSTERETLSSPREALRTSRTGSIELDHIHSPSPVRSSSVEPFSRHEAVSEYEGFLDQQELEALKKAQQLQSLTKTIGSTPSTTPPVKPPPGPAHYQHPPPPISWPLGITTQIPPTQSSTTLSMGTPAPPAAGQPPQTFGPTAGPPRGPPPGPPPPRLGQLPPGPPPGPPPRRSPGQPPFAPPTSHAVLPFIGQPAASLPLISCSPLQPVTTAVVTPTPPSTTSATSSPTSSDQATISTTVARCLKVIETVKSLAVQPPAKPVKTVQFSLPTESPSASSPQTSAETDEDIKTKQKEKLDLYNQRIMEKREQQYKERLTRKKEEKNKDGTLISPGKPISSEPKNIWICGHSLVFWAESRAKSPEVGMQLGMDPSKVAIWWKGTQGMTWPQLLPQLHQLKVTWPNPDVLIIHLGGNDLSTDSPTDLLASVKKDLTSMRSIFPQCVLVWSNILPRRVWRHSEDSHEVDLVRTTVNRRIQNIISDLGGTSLTHDNIRCGANTGLYRTDGVHLSPKGIDVYNLNLQDFLEKWEIASEKS